MEEVMHRFPRREEEVVEDGGETGGRRSDGRFSRGSGGIHNTLVHIISDGLILLPMMGKVFGHRSVVTDDIEPPVTGKDPSKVKVTFDGVQLKSVTDDLHL
uniref:Uncharacterized protein n=1 Tax=Oryza brachyantha TaxID=4533 RepID=J3NCM4_ORYBR